MTGKELIARLFSNWIVKLLSIAAAIMLFIFQRVGSLEERFFSIPLNYYVSDGFVATDVSVGSVRINMRGSEEEIFNVLEDDIEAFIDVTDHESEGIFRSPVLLMKKGSAETVDVEMSIEPLHATVTIETKITKDLGIIPQLKGYPAAGYELVQTLTTPELLKISGPRSQVEPVAQLQTGIIELTGRKSDFTIRVPIRVDNEMISLTGSSIVEVHGIVREIIIQREFTVVDFRLLNLNPAYVLSDSVTAGSILLTGPQLILESLRPGDLVLEVDCGPVVVPGSYELAVRPAAPEGTAILTYQPSVLKVEVVSANDAAPRPSTPAVPEGGA